MTRTIRPARLILLVAFIATIGTTGCSKKMWIYQVPAFYSPDLKSVAVLPFRNESTARGQNPGNVVADKLAAALMANGTYRVYARGDLKALLDESDLQLALSGKGNADYSKMMNVDAVLVGAVNTYAATSADRIEQQPVYAYDANGNQYISHYIPRKFTRNEANVSVTATLLRRTDGTTIHATPGPIHKQTAVDGSPPSMDPFACAAVATDATVRDLVEEFAVVRKQIKIDPGKALQTATGLYDNKWETSKKFRVDDEKMFVVVALPPECDRNPFRITIVRKDGREDLAEHKLVWTKQNATLGIQFSPRDIAAKGGGAGDYEVKFYSGPEPIMRQGFKIVAR